jgi:hypothetical protein
MGSPEPRWRLWLGVGLFSKPMTWAEIVEVSKAPWSWR